MNTIVFLLTAVLLAFLLAMLIARPVIALMCKLKGSQPILHYVTQHKEKAGTPTMGGVIFLVPMLAACLILCRFRFQMWLSGMLIVLSYGVIGFLDDFIKVKFKKNEGLKPYQKIIPQLLIAGFATYFMIKNKFIGTEVYVPFAGYIDFGYFFIPLALIALIGMSNAVNLTDGLDGLAGKCSLCYFTAFVMLGYGLYIKASAQGATLYADELKTFLLVPCSLIGGLLGFLWYNSYRASIYMGDTGALALGGAAGVTALFLKTPFLSLFAGIMFVVSCISVILQVGYYKLTKKRIFLMAPFHHHLELKGYHEAKIVSFYVIATFIGSVLTLMLANV